MIRPDRTTSTAIVDTRQPYYPMKSCPVGKSLILLGQGGVAVISQWDGKDTFWRGWAPMPVWKAGVSDV